MSNTDIVFRVNTRIRRSFIPELIWKINDKYRNPHYEKYHQYTDERNSNDYFIVRHDKKRIRY